MFWFRFLPVRVWRRGWKLKESVSISFWVPWGLRRAVPSAGKARPTKRGVSLPGSWVTFAQSGSPSRVWHICWWVLTFLVCLRWRLRWWDLEPAPCVVTGSCWGAACCRVIIYYMSWSVLQNEKFIIFCWREQIYLQPGSQTDEIRGSFEMHFYLVRP